MIGSSLEANLKIKLSKKNFDLAKNIDFSELCITSSASVEESKSKEFEITTLKAEGSKCPVCWKISPHQCERHN